MSSAVNILGGVTNHGGSMFNGNPSFQGENIHFNAPQATNPYQCLNDLYSSDPSAEKARLETAEDKLIPDSYTWIFQDSAFLEWLHDDKSSVLRLIGGPGKGKTMTMIGLTNHLAENIKSQLRPSAISYFFCRATDDRLSDATLVLKGLIHYLLSQESNQNLIHHLKHKYDKGGAKIFDGTSCGFVLQEILIDILLDNNFKQFYFLIDALDECTTGINDLLNLIRLTTTKSSKIKWLVSSRNNIDIDGFFRVFRSHLTISLESHKPEVDSGISAYIKEKVRNLSLRNRYSPEQMHNITQELNRKAEGTYLWVHLACKILEKCRGSKALAALKDIPSGLEPFYGRMAQGLRDQNDTFDDPALCSLILATVTVALRPLRLRELLAITNPLNNDEDLEELVQRITECGSFLLLQNETIYFIHQSAKDFLEKQAGLETSIIPEGLQFYHEMIGRSSLSLFREYLREDICDLKLPGFRVSDLSTDQRALVSHLEYACCNWVTHLIKAGAEAGLHSQISDMLEEFLDRHLLHWIEVLSLLERFPEGVSQIFCLQQIYNSTEGSLKLKDTKRFMLENQICLTAAPLQVYSGALIFSPDRSWVKTAYSSLIPTWVNVRPMLEDHWQGCQEIKTRAMIPNLLAISSDSQLLAALNEPSEVIVYNIWSGTQQATTNCSSASVLAQAPPDPPSDLPKDIQCIRFTEDNTQILAAFWVSSNPALATLHISSNAWITKFPPVSLNAVPPSPVFQKAYILPDATRCIWYDEKNIILCRNTPTGECVDIRCLGKEPIFISHFIISPNGRFFAFSNLALNEILVYDMGTSSCICKFLGDHDSDRGWPEPESNNDSLCKKICFSQTGELIATLHGRGKVILRTTSNGHCRQTIEAPQDTNRVYLSRTGRKLICMSRSLVCQMWVYDMENSSVELEVSRVFLDSYENGRFILDESESRSANRYMVLWDPDFPRTVLNLGVVLATNLSTGISIDGKLLAKQSKLSEIKVFDIDDSWQTKPSRQDLNLSPFPYLKDLENSAIGLQPYKPMRKFGGHKEPVLRIIFSPDGTKVASASSQSILVWHPITLAGQKTLYLPKLSKWTGLLSFSNDGNKLAVELNTFRDDYIFMHDKKFSIWDISGTPTCEATISVPSRNLPFDIDSLENTALALSPDNGLLLKFFADCGNLKIEHWDIPGTETRSRPNKSYQFKDLDCGSNDKRRVASNPKRRDIFVRARFSNSGKLVAFTFIISSNQIGIALYMPDSGTIVSRLEIMPSALADYRSEPYFSQDDKFLRLGGEVIKINDEDKSLIFVEDTSTRTPQPYLSGRGFEMRSRKPASAQTTRHNLLYIPSRYLPYSITSYSWSKDGLLAVGCTSGKVYTLGINNNAVNSLLIDF